MRATRKRPTPGGRDGEAPSGSGTSIFASIQRNKANIFYLTTRRCAITMLVIVVLRGCLTHLEWVDWGRSDAGAASCG
jgi:hypothetical protein